MFRNNFCRGCHAYVLRNQSAIIPTNNISTLFSTIVADFHRAMVATAQEKTPHRAPPCEELDPPYDIKLDFVQKIHLFLAKSTKPVATSAALFDSSMHKSFVGWRFAADPTGGAYSAPPDPLAVFRGLLLKRGEGDSGVTMGWLLRLVTGAALVVGGPRQF